MGLFMSHHTYVGQRRMKEEGVRRDVSVLVSMSIKTSWISLKNGYDNLSFKRGKWSWELPSFPIDINKTHVVSSCFTIHYLILYCELFVLTKISFISILFIKGRNFLLLHVSFFYFLCVWMHMCLCLWCMCVVCTHVCVCKCVYLWLCHRGQKRM